MGLRDWLSGSDLEVRSDGRPWWMEPNTVALTNTMTDMYGASATTLAYQVPTAVRCIEIISTQVAQFTPQAWRNDVELEDQPRLFRRPDPFSDLFRFQMSSVVDMLCEGFALWEHTSLDEFGRPLTLRHMPAAQVEIRWNPAKPAAQAMLERDRQIKYGGATIDPRRVTLVPMIEIPGEARPIGPVQAGRAVSVGQVTADALVRSNFVDGEYPSGTIEVPTNLSADQADRLLEGFMMRRLKYGKRAPAVMAGGAQFKMNQLTMRDAQWIEARKWGAAEFARLFGVPISMLDLPTEGSNVTYTTQVGERTELLHSGLSPIIARLESAFGSMLPSTQQCHVDTTNYLPPLEAIVPSAADKDPNGPPMNEQPATTPEEAAQTGGNADVF